MNILKTGIISICISVFAVSQALAGADEAVTMLQTRWAEVNYQLQGDAQKEAFEELVDVADNLTAQYPQSSGVWVWSGIVKSTYAGVRGGLGALGLAKASRRDLETAMKLDPAALDGSAYTSLGTLYYSVPGWPVGFGDEDKAEELLSKALEISPNGIDANYFYAQFKEEQKDYKAAREYYLAAQAADPRPGREVADAGRQAEISAALAGLKH